MIRTVALNLTDDLVSSIPLDRSMEVAASVTEHDFWQDVDYLILCHNAYPSWIAKINELVFPRDKDAPLLFRFSEIRSIMDLSEEQEVEKNKVIKPFYTARRLGKWPQLTEFEDDRFFTIGDYLPFISQPTQLGPLSMDQAAKKLAKTYGVEPDQVEIIIHSKPFYLSRIQKK
ncbi:hypothetical protein [Pseudomonas protegens]|uniref:hypothetical protein n=1 Tax=Pseudomonas protegens TaxID=380021 RepID=UPI0011AF72D8|nr:hypothetical protein [Pseudomonas protegens]